MLNILFRELSSASLALVGEPLKGLQIMGILETRALGFKNVVICSANEDILPRKARMDSFIPFEIRRYHHLPGKREKEAVYAYHFYRIIQHAENVTLLFHSDTTDSKGSEKSRYVHQIAFELARENEQVSIKEIGLAKETRSFTERVLEVQKNPEVIENIKNVITTKISASAINRYFDSPLEWYYGYVLKLAQPETNRELDPATFGDLVHKTLEVLKTPVFNQPVTAAIIENMIARADEELKKKFTANEKSKQFQYGLNHLHFEMASEMVRRYLISEKDCVKRGESIVYLKAEMKLSRSLFFEWEGETIEAKFEGFADSVQKRDGRIHIIDFKTGMVQSSDLKVTEFNTDVIGKKPKALQLLLYNWMGREEFPNQSIASQIISLPKPGVRDLVMKTDVNSDENEAAFESLLVEILKDMLDRNKTISADQEYKYNVYE
jgi:RecB family exonuclease